MILDVNGCFGSWPYWPMKGTDPRSIVEKMDRCGIDRVFLSSLRGVFTDPEQGNRETIEAAAAFPDRILPAFTFSPYAPGSEALPSLLEDHPVSLLKLFPLNHSYQLHEEPLLDDLLQRCGERKIPVLIPHRLLMSWRVPTLPLPSVDSIIARFPETRFILGSINYLFELQTARYILRRHPNAFIETSAMMAYREIEKLVAEFGAERLIHGSGVPLQNPAIGPLKIQRAEISDEEKRMILSGNLAGLFSHFP